MKTEAEKRDEMIHTLAVDTKKREAVGELSIGFRYLSAGIYQVGTFFMDDGYRQQEYGRKMMGLSLPY